MRGRLFLVLVSLLAAHATGQRLPFVTYNTSDGLINNRCHVVRQDGDGYIWIGTDHGIVRFDGRTFRHFPCPDDAYRSARCAVEGGGAVHFAVDGFGVAECRGGRVRFQKAAVPLTGINGILRMAPMRYLLSESRLGICELAGTALSPLQYTTEGGSLGTPLEMMQTRDGAVWVGSSQGLAVFPPGQMNRAVCIPTFAGRYINVVRAAPDGSVYVGCAAGLFNYPPGTEPLAGAPPRRVDARPGTTGLAFGAQGDMWVSNADLSLLHFLPMRLPSVFSSRQGLQAASVWDAYRDVEGTLWFATENGLSKLSRQNIVLYDFSAEPYSSIKSGIVWDDSTFLVSNGKTLWALGTAGLRRIAGLSSTPGFVAERMLRAPGARLWFVSSEITATGPFVEKAVSFSFNGRSLSDPRSLSSYPGGPRSLDLSQGAAADGDKDLWVKTDRGLLHFDGAAFLPVSLTGFDGKRAEVTSLCRSPDGTVWILDRGMSLIRCQVQRSRDTGAQLIPDVYLDSNFLKRGQPITAPTFSHYGPFERIMSDSAGHIFLGGRKGLIIVVEMPNSEYAVLPMGDYSALGDSTVNFTTTSQYITALCMGTGNQAWVGTANGLDRMRFAHRSMQVDKSVYKSELCGAYIFFIRAQREKIFVGTTGCLAVIDGSVKTEPVPPRIYLTGLRVQNASRDSLLERRSQVRFGPEEDNISFHFTGISFADERGLRYRYRLLGLDDVWSPPSREASMTFSRVPPGEYTFEVEAESVYGIRSAEPARFHFRVARPVWARWWFIALAVLSVGSGVYALYRYRIRQIMAIQRIRQKISKDLHDDIGATVSSIGILASIAQNEGVDEHKREQFLHTISDQSKYVAETLSDIVWTINPANDSLEVLLARVLRYATELFEARGIDYEVEGPPEGLHRLSLSMDARQNFYLILKEAINNLAKHSAATEAHIRLYIEGGRFISSIEDNGRGFDVETATAGNGMDNLAKRAAALGAQLSVQSAVGKGTRIRLSLPAPK